MTRKRLLGKKNQEQRLSPFNEGQEWDARRAQRLRTAETLRTGRTPLPVIAVADQASVSADQGIQAALAQHPPRPPLACAEGCAWCCHKIVGCAVPEVLRIVSYLQQQLSPEEMAATRNRIVQRDEERRALRHDRWAAKRLACPLLVDQRCSVYPVRPLTCRGFNSTDVRQCERSFKTREPVQVPTHAASHRLATFVLAGLRDGLCEVGLQDDLLELTSALRVAVTLPKAADRWQAGEAVFAVARLD
jgi:Fe-S-cluster containining protein